MSGQNRNGWPIWPEYAIADSFDYRNKYAIIQYLKEIAEESSFYQILLTHNFDFFRTVHSRFVHYQQCFMASKDATGITLLPPAGIKNVFVKDWKGNFFADNKKKVACIPFMRNIIEYTKGDSDADFLTLTALLHCKTGSEAITVGQVDAIYTALFLTTGPSTDGDKPMVDLIREEATACLGAAHAANFENKIVLSIAIRFMAEQFMVNRINDAAFVNAIDSNQTTRLLSKFRQLFGRDGHTVDVLQRVVLMTPENIHLNSFMYEPILDMSDEHLRTLYRDVASLH